MPGGHLKEQQIHPAERLALPGGGLADIDLRMIPLVRALWALNFTTMGCCQDLGESIEHNGHGSPVQAKDRQRWATFYKGHAWLKLPVNDAERLIGILGGDQIFGHRMRRWTHPEAWQAVLWLIPTDDGCARPEPTAQITFPAPQIKDLVNLLTTRWKTLNDARL
ncbi:hypothetical protein [Actinomadura violacea]|uniref:Uncharacterized protein n=1 Tax=Actinomadura violacea TaxID=2819934 RepID=A0ABS3S892_9ACTN|nr:hypothetical protein [Actinomadura violacea]MBO2465222.1 hypothetical protein [Actinomadura violacea]